ncbi:MAG: 7TM diverse intracellular signaling domain-containing protein [Cyclobacteriaceae bacterium]
MNAKSNLRTDLKIHWLADTTKVLTIEDIRSAPAHHLFDKNTYSSPYFGYTTYPHWFRLILPKDYVGEALSVIINYSSIQNIKLINGNKEYWAGREVPVENWPLKARNIVFELSNEHADTLYLRAQEKASLIVPIRVKTKSDYRSDSLVENVLYGCFFGFVVALILYNLMLFFSLQDITYLYYIIAMAAGGLVAAIRAGYAVVYWWPNNSVLDDRIYLICAGTSIAASSRFVAHFLSFPKTNKMVDRYLWFVTALAMGMVVSSFFFTFVELTNYGRLLVVLGVPSFLGLGIWQWKNGYRPARFFVIAWIPYMFGLVLIVLKGAGAVPYSPIVDLSAEFGTSLEAILLSFALADRITTYKNAQAEAEKRALKSDLEKQGLITKNRELDYDLKLREKDLQNEQQQLATLTLWLTQKNQLLHEIQNALENGNKNTPNLSKKVKQSLHAEEDWNRVKEHFEKVHPNFFQRLISEFPYLTPNEQRLCAYLRMNLNTKEIATLLGVSVNAIEQARRRLRKKLGIANTDTSLLTFLQELS